MLAFLEILKSVFLTKDRRALRLAQQEWCEASAAYRAAKARDDRRGMNTAAKIARAKVHACLRLEMGGGR